MKKKSKSPIRGKKIKGIILDDPYAPSIHDVLLKAFYGLPLKGNVPVPILYSTTLVKRKIKNE